ncbi:MAG: flagellar hook basal-body protein [Spirochaetes bacterium]|nr:flagellar hook basal-body protein [Spirochaetota bacterium]
MSKRNFIAIILLSVLLAASSSDIYSNDGYARRYDLLYRDLINWKTYGYRARLFEINNVSQGALELSGNSLSMAVLGEGFFKVKKNDRIYYTRNGNFSINEFSQIVNNDGYFLVLDKNPPKDFSASGIKVAGNVLRIPGINNRNNFEEQIVLYNISAAESDGVYFSADKAEADNKSRIRGFVLETSTTNILNTLIEMKFILGSIAKDDNRFKCTNTKLGIIDISIANVLSKKANDLPDCYDPFFDYFKYLDRLYSVQY